MPVALTNVTNVYDDNFGSENDFKWSFSCPHSEDRRTIFICLSGINPHAKSESRLHPSMYSMRRPYKVVPSGNVNCQMRVSKQHLPREDAAYYLVSTIKPRNRRSLCQTKFIVSECFIESIFRGIEGIDEVNIWKDLSDIVRQSSKGVIWVSNELEKKMHVFVPAENLKRSCAILNQRCPIKVRMAVVSYENLLVCK